MNEDMTKLLLAPLAAIVIRVSWDIASIPAAWVRELFMKKPVPINIVLSVQDRHRELFKNASFKCLVIRYGTDLYIQHMANDQEKYDGRLRNNVIDCDYTDGKLSFFVPLHKRLGTQFKCFVDFEHEDDVKNILKHKDEFTRVHSIDESSSPYEHRLYYLLRDYGDVETIDGFKNNILMPY